MFFLSLWTVFLLLAVFLLSLGLPLLKNIQTAKKTGLRYIVVPWYAYSRVRVVRVFLRPVNWLLGEPAITSWRRLVGSTWPWKLHHLPFAHLGTDTFLTVAPGGILVHTADADVITQITSRGTDFPKPTHVYRSIDLYGKNVVSSEGATWRHHRKLTSPAFTEKNNQLVWKETLDRSQTMVASWLQPDGSSKTIDHVAGDTMQLSLNIISRAGLGHVMEWSREAEEAQSSERRLLAEGHSLTFSYALTYLLRHLYYPIFFPRWVLKNAPFAVMRGSLAAYDEWGMYMKEMVAAKKSAIHSGASESSAMDLIGQLIKGQQEEAKADSRRLAALADSEVLGNLFIFIIAGHETSANSIHFALMLLALHPEIQQKAQLELTEIFGGRPISQWDYERDLPRLLNGLLGAILSEELRLIAPIVNVPKMVCSTPQALTIDGRQVTLPANTVIKLCIPSVHRNPKFWPTGPPKNPTKPSFPLGQMDDDLEEFKPERWLKTGAGGDESAAVECQAQGTPTQKSLYTPVKGSYIPFSDGQRACLGRRFAQVEVLAALAVILSRHTVELAVDEWATDEEVAQMTALQRRQTWEKAAAKANWTWQNKMKQVITLQLRNACVPMRFMRKGEERFVPCLVHR